MNAFDRRTSGSHPCSRTVAEKTTTRSRLIRLLAKFPQRTVWAVFVLCMGFASIAILSAVAMISHTPFVLPSLGPTAILFFFHPMSASASPRHALYGRYWDFVRLWITSCDGIAARGFWRDWSYRCAPAVCSGSFAWSHRIFHGFAEGRSCTCRSHHPDRFSGDTQSALAYGGDRDCGSAALPASHLLQPAGWFELSAMGWTRG